MLPKLNIGDASVFIAEIICSATSIEELNNLEIHYIKTYDCIYPNGYNLATGGGIGRSSRGIPSWNKGKKATLQAIQNQSKAHIGQKAWNKGISPTEEVREKMSLAKFGKHLSPSTEFKKGQTSVFKGKKHTPEALALISKNNGGSIKLLCNETGELFPSIIAAVRKLGIDKTTLRELLITGRTHSRTQLSFKKVEN